MGREREWVEGGKWRQQYLIVKLLTTRPCHPGVIVRFFDHYNHHVPSLICITGDHPILVGDHSIFFRTLYRCTPACSLSTETCFKVISITVVEIIKFEVDHIAGAASAPAAVCV